MFRTPIFRKWLDAAAAVVSAITGMPNWPDYPAGPRRDGEKPAH